MRSPRWLVPGVLASLATVAAAQSPASTPSDPEKSFTLLKALAGSWRASVTTDPPLANMGNGSFTQVSLRVTSRGHALVEEMHEAGKPEDPTRYDHPLTMFYLDGDQLLLTHYCDAGNRPRMAARISPDGKTVEFDFLDLSGSNAYGHMYHALFTLVDANHHIEEWTYMMAGEKPLKAHLELTRAQ